MKVASLSMLGAKSEAYKKIPTPIPTEEKLDAYYSTTDYVKFVTDLSQLKAQYMKKLEESNADYETRINRIYNEQTRIIFFVYPFSDGSGDYAMVDKTIKLLQSMGVQTKHISLVLVPMDFNDLIFKNMIDELKKCDVPESSMNLSDIQEDPFQKTDEREELIDDDGKIYFRGNDESIIITPDEYTKIMSIFNQTCKKYKSIYPDRPYPDVSSCDDTPIDAEDMQKSIIDMLRHHYSIFKETYSNKIREWRTLTPRPKFVEWAGKELEVNVKCKIKTNTFLEFVKFSLSNEYLVVWFRNVIHFFLPYREKGLNIFYKNRLDLASVKINELTDHPKPILLSFLEKPELRFPTDPLFKSLPHVHFSEGGFCESAGGLVPNSVTPGFGKPSCIGINLIDHDVLKRLQENYHPGNYNVCYFGNTSSSSPMDAMFLVLLFKLRYFIKKVKDLYPGSVIKVNKSSYEGIRTCPKEYLKILGTVETELGNYLVVDDVRIDYYEAMSSQDFLQFVYNSHPLCILRGDQSYSEGISMGKIVLYDFLSFKMYFYKQMVQMYLAFLKELYEKKSRELTNLFTSINISDDYLKITNAILQKEAEKPTIVIKDKSAGFDYEIRIKFKIYKISFDDSYLQSLYDFTYDTCSKVVNDETQKVSFFAFLEKSLNFETNLKHRIQEAIREIEPTLLGKKSRSRRKVVRRTLKRKLKKY